MGNDIIIKLKIAESFIKEQQILIRSLYAKIDELIDEKNAIIHKYKVRVENQTEEIKRLHIKSRKICGKCEKL